MNSAFYRIVPSLIVLLAAGVRAAERRIIRNLQHAGAFSSSTATAIHTRTPISRSQLRRLCDRGAVEKTAAGNYFLNNESYLRYRAARRRRALTVVAVLLPVMLLVWLLARSYG